MGFVLSSLTLSNTIARGENSNRELGKRTYPIWLLFNPKYPEVHRDIWRPVLDVIQDRVYRKLQTRIDTSDIFIRSAVDDRGIVPKTSHLWGWKVAEEIELYREIILEHKPKMLISFGAFPYEFARRVYEVKPEKGPKAWGTSNLKDEFKQSMKNFEICQTNLIPLLRRINVTDEIKETRNILSRNEMELYFQDVGAKLADKIIENKNNLDIWI